MADKKTTVIFVYILYRLFCAQHWFRSPTVAYCKCVSQRTDFEVLGLGLEASSPRKLACPRLEDSTNFVERLKNFLESVFSWRSLEKFLWRPFFFFFFFWRSPEKFLWRPFFFLLESTCALCPWSLALASSIPVLGLESVCPRKGCPWPWPWPRIFFVSLALASSLVSSTPPLVFPLF